MGSSAHGQYLHCLSRHPLPVPSSCSFRQYLPTGIRGVFFEREQLSSNDSSATVAGHSCRVHPSSFGKRAKLGLVAWLLSGLTHQGFKGLGLHTPWGGQATRVLRLLVSYVQVCIQGSVGCNVPHCNWHRRCLLSPLCWATGFLPIVLPCALVWAVLFAGALRVCVVLWAREYCN